MTGACRSYYLGGSAIVVDIIRLGVSSTAGAPIYHDCFLLWQNFDAIEIEKWEANKVVQ
jgi:hypothetical protein